MAVTDDTLVQSVGELRRALGEDGPRLVRTVPRRGYRLDAAVAPVSEPAADEAADATVNRQVNEAPNPPAGATSAVIARRRWAAAKPAVVTLAALLLAGLIAVGFAGGWRVLVASRPGAQTGAETTTSAEKPTIAVLPFANLTGDATRAYLVDGLTQDLIDALGRFSELTVMSWNAVLPYREKPASPAAASRALDVRYQVEGSIRENGDHVRVDARLINTAGQVLWSARFDSPAGELFSLQDKIAADIAGILAVQVNRAEGRRAFAKPPQNLQAYDMVLRARPALQSPERGSVATARVLLRQAIALDPNSAAAYTGLAESYYIAVSMGWAEEPMRFLGRATEAATKALALDDADVPAHVVLGRISIFYHRYDEALAEMGRAIAINPNDANALAGRGNALMWMGQTENAISALEAAQRLDPDLRPARPICPQPRLLPEGALRRRHRADSAQPARDRRRELQPGCPRRRLRRGGPRRRCGPGRGRDPPPRSDLRSAAIRQQVSQPGRSYKSARGAAQGRPLVEPTGLPDTGRVTDPPSLIRISPAKRTAGSRPRET